MQWLRDGVVNAGLVMFVLAIGSTAVVGRFFCGWACHVVALQDLCGHLMTRLGVRPKPFRSRVLAWGPLAMALYMFGWPVVVREVGAPLLADPLGRLPAWLGEWRPWPGVTGGFLTHDFWATFPAWYIAVPFLAVCGFGCVYLLGAKGFCTYACPYGGVFGPVERVAPGRIRVSDACEGCGHCTAVCTSNVRVHEEVRDYGMVVDPGCMKCLDCVSACPMEALSLGFGSPAIGASARPGREESAAQARATRAARYDPSLREDLAIGVLAVVLLAAWRGMFNQLPLLMAAGMAVAVSFGAWVCVQLVRRPNVRVQSVQLKFKGQVLGTGWVFAGATVLLLALAAWSGAMRSARWGAAIAYASLETPVGVALAPGFTAPAGERHAAERVVALTQLSGPRAGGGFGWALRAEELTNLAYAQVVLGRFADAEASLTLAVDEGRPGDGLILQLAEIMRVRGAGGEEIELTLAKAVDRFAGLSQARSSLARARLSAGDIAAATAIIEQGARSAPRDGAAVAEAARFMSVELGRPAEGEAMLRAFESRGVRVIDASDATALSRAWIAADGPERAKAWARRAIASSRVRAPTGADAGAAWALVAAGLNDEALAHARWTARAAGGRGRYVGQADALLISGLVERTLGDPRLGLALVRRGAALVAASDWETLGAARAIAAHAERTGDTELGAFAEDLARKAASRLGM